MSGQFHQLEDPERVFSVLGSEIRLAILRRLWESDASTLTFSELYDMVDVDDTGQFNYHLEQLVGHFLTKTETGYRLTQAGKHVNGAIASGTYTLTGQLEPIQLDGSCRMCGGTQQLQYDTETVDVECDACGSGWTGIVPPAALAGRDRDAIPQVVSDHLRTQFRRIATGFCTYCNGATSATAGPLAELDVGVDPDEESEQLPDHPSVQIECRRCGHLSGLSLDYTLLFTEPEVEGFFYEQGIRVRDMPIWEVPGLAPDTTTIVARDPYRMQVRYEIDEVRLAVTVDENLTILDLEQVSE